VTGDLGAQLTVAPPTVGASTFTLQIWEKGTPITGDTGAAIIHLYPTAQPVLRANLTPVAHGARFTVRGSLATSGAWRADVLVRTATVNDYRTLPFTFTVGPGATFLAPDLNPAAITITVAPGRISAPNTFTITGVRAPAVRLLSQSLDMNMGIIPYPATPLGGGRWRVGNAYAPMEGRWGLTVQAQKNGAWTTLRQFVYQVPLSGPMRLLTPQASTATTGTSAGSTRPSNLSRAYNVAFARTLPYTGFVTEMGSNGVRMLQTGRLLHTGLQAHGVDVLDGTPYAYVTNFGAEPGTVSQIDVRTMRSSDLSMLDLRSGAIRRIAFPGDHCFEPHGIDIAEDGRTLYVACAGGAWIYTVDARTLRPGRVVVTAPGANMRGVKLAHTAGRGADDRHRWRQPRRPLAKALD
jgi:hypothetical protein